MSACSPSSPSPTTRRRSLSSSCSRSLDSQPETRSELLVHAGGNPLYAEQYVRMVSEHGAEHAVPESVQALIVARLDGLPEPEKRVAQDASVTGGVFWTGSVAAAGGRRPLGGGRAPAHARAESVRAPLGRGVGGGRDGVGLRPCTRPGCRLRGDPARAQVGEAPAGGGLDRVAASGRTTTPSSSLITTSRRWTWAQPRGST